MMTTSEVILNIAIILAMILPWIYFDHKFARQWVGIGRRRIWKLLSLLPPVVAGLMAAHILSVYKVDVDFSEPQKPIRMVYDSQGTLSITGLPFSGALPAEGIPSNALPSNAIPSNAIPSNAIPSNAIPSNAIPSNAIPSNALPAEAIPSNAIPSNAIPSNVIIKTFTNAPSGPLPDFGEKVCGSGRCGENTKYTYMSDEAGIELAGPPEEISGSISVQFYADAYALTLGECTSIHWDVVGANKVLINDIPSDVSGVKQICPEGSQTYLVIATDSRGAEVSSSLLIQVQEPQASNAGQELGSLDRCMLFDGGEIEYVAFPWTKNEPFEFYLKIPGGVPGLEKEILGDNEPWDYSVQIGDYSTDDCRVYPNDVNAKEELYCSITIPKEAKYEFSNQPIKLSVNGCNVPVMSQVAQIPQYVEAPASASGGGGGGGGEELACPAGQTYHDPNTFWSGGCCSDGHWYYYYASDPDPGCWADPAP
jgi:hypothetical protein